MHVPKNYDVFLVARTGEWTKQCQICLLFTIAFNCMFYYEITQIQNTAFFMSAEQQYS